MKENSAKKTVKLNKKQKIAVLAIIIEAVLCIFYVVILSLCMNGDNFRIFTVISCVFYLAVIIALTVCLYMFNKYKKSSGKKDSFPETEEKSDV